MPDEPDGPDDADAPAWPGKFVGDAGEAAAITAWLKKQLAAAPTASDPVPADPDPKGEPRD